MSAHSSRMQYDYPAYAEALKRSTDPLKYYLYPGYGYNCNECFPSAGVVDTHAGNISNKHAIDIDSIMSGRTVLNSKANDFSQPTPLNYQTSTYPLCNRFIEPEYSRFTHPIQNYRGMYPDRFYPLIQDPQCNIFWNFEVNSQLEAKDNHLAIFQIPLDPMISGLTSPQNLTLGPKMN